MTTMINKPILDKQTALVLNKLKEKGYEAYLVGGYVRNAVMNRDLSDIDITTNAFPEEVKAVFCDFNVIETGIKHGTVTVMVECVPVEITTYRAESTYSDNRHPDSVSFTRNLKDDLSRRDFTMNALCFDGEEIIDIFGGLEDINNKIIRTIGDAEHRFSEDALRILRALRFSSVLGFEIEENTAKAIHKLKYLLSALSVERVFSELKKLLCGKNVRKILVEYIDIFEYILPELKGMNGFNQHNFHHKYDILNHTAVVVENAPAEPVLRLAALFHDCGKVDTFSLDEYGVGHFYSHATVSAQKADSALKRLKSDNACREMVVKLVKIHDTPIEESDKVILRKLNRYGEDILRKLIKLQIADTMGLADEYKNRLDHFSNLEKILDDVLNAKSPFGLKDLEISGFDMMELGLSGKDIGCALNLALDSVIDGKVANVKNDLIEYIKSVYIS